MSSSFPVATLRLPATDLNAVKEDSAPPLPGSVLQLTQGLAAADERSFREFHERYFDRIYHFLLVVTRGREDEAREALQQTYLRVLRYVRSFESEEAFWAWLKVVARSAARDGNRKRRRYMELLQNFAFRWRMLREPSDGQPEIGLVLQEVLQDLPPEDRQLIHAKYIQGATVKELAVQVGATDKAVESRLLRLRRLLRDRTLQKLQGS